MKRNLKTLILNIQNKIEHEIEYYGGHERVIRHLNDIITEIIKMKIELKEQLIKHERTDPDTIKSLIKGHNGIINEVIGEKL